MLDGEPIRVLRVIARLNVGGPALHVAYLSAGLQERGYETTLVAGELARGEESMAAVAESRGVEVLAVSQLHREVSPVRDLVAAFRRLEEAGRLELLTCGATHGFLPLMQMYPEAVRAQIAVAVAHHRRHFGKDPVGIWLPECGYFPGLDRHLGVQALYQAPGR